jgi:tetratricopeptide (TPR) repeat protein
MKMFRRKRKINAEINQLLRLLEENPEDVKSRLTLANLYLETDDQKKALEEYGTAVRQLRVEGSDLEAIATCKKILTLDGLSLPENSSASVEQAEQLIVKAREVYEEVLQLGPRVRAKGASESYSSDNHEKSEDAGAEEIPREGGGESVPFEVVPEVSGNQAWFETGSFESAGDQSLNHQDASSGTSPPGDVIASYRDDGDETTIELPDKALEENDVHGAVAETEITPTMDSFSSAEEPRIDRIGVQMDDDLETMLLGSEAEASTDEASSPRGADTREDSPQPDNAEKGVEASDQEDPDLPYNLGVAYYEMDLIDKAVKEFASAHNQGIKAVESLYMLAKCYVKKGLLHNAAGFIVQAMKLDNLTQVQIDMLHEQLEEIKARMNLAGSPAS